MATNTQAPFGFSQHNGTGSAPTYEQVTGTIAYNTAAIYFNDPIFRLANGSLAGATTGPGPGTGILAGIFVGCKYLSTSQKRIIWSNYWPGSDVSAANSSYTEAYYVNDPNAQFQVQSGNSAATDTVGITAANVGLNVQFAYGTGNAASGLSGAYIDLNVAPATTSTFPFRVIGLVTSPPGVNGTNAGGYNYAIVAFNNVETKSLTAQN